MMGEQTVEEGSEAVDEVSGSILTYYDGHRWAAYEDGAWLPAVAAYCGDNLMAATGTRDHIRPGLWFLDGGVLVAVTSESIDPADTTPLDVNMMLVGTGATYRQLDYWVRRHYLCDDRITKGSGRNRTWNLADYVIATLVVRLGNCGLAVEDAVRAAQFAVFNGTAGANLGIGVSITWEQPK